MGRLDGKVSIVTGAGSSGPGVGTGTVSYTHLTLPTILRV